MNMEKARAVLFVAVVTFLYQEIDGRSTNPKIAEDTRLGIFDGHATDISNFPYTASIKVDTGSNNAYFYVGVIVSNRWVVTAANWTCSLSPNEVRVFAGAPQSSSEGSDYGVEKIVKQPQFKPKDYHYQIACIKIDGKFQWSDSIAKVFLPSQPVKGKTNFLVAGYGASGMNSQDLLFGAMDWMTSKFCSDTFKHWGINWSDRLACAYNSSSTTLCKGDIGTGFVRNKVLYGIFIGAVDEDLMCTVKAYPDILANIYPAAKWIHQITGAQYKK